MFLRYRLGASALAGAVALLGAPHLALAQGEDSGWLEPDDGSAATGGEVSPAEYDAESGPAENREVPPPPPPRGAEGLDDSETTERAPRIFEPEPIEEVDPTTYAGPTTEASEAGSSASAKTNRQARPGPPTLLGQDGPIAYGGYGGVDVRWSRIASQDALLVGGEGALLLNHRLAIGAAGYGLSNLIRGPRSSSGNPSYIGLGYGGLVVRHNFVNERPVYLSVGTLVGAGGVGFFEQVGEYEFEFDENQFDADPFFVVEPSLDLHANLTRWMRVGASVGYRFTEGIDAEGFTDADFRGPSAGGHVQFGWF
jgi:hypothetical protein